MNDHTFVWAENSRVYHEQPWAGERCNVDQLVDRKTGNEPPVEYGTRRPKRLCTYCRRAKQRAQGVQQ